MQTHSLSPLVGDRYQVVAELGRGGMGAVFRATDRLTGQPVALKRLLARRTAGDETDDLSLRLDLSHEFQTLASLRHPNIISVLDYGFDQEQQPYFTMTLLENALPLRQASRDQPLLVKAGWVIQVLQALVYLHRHGIIHRDLKPENILVSADGQVRVLDFGLAVARDRADVDTLAGTLEYMAPEVLEGEEPSRASDLYAVGVMLYEFIAGHHPFKGEDIYEVIDNVLSTEPDMTDLETAVREYITGEQTTVTQSQIEPPEPSEAAVPLQDIPGAPLTQVVQTLLVKRPDYRYDDAQRVIDDLNWALGLPPPEDSAAIRESFLQAAKFVGREAEFDRLAQAVDHLHDGAGSLWLVGGESGVGKSRLLDELRTLAMVHGVLVLRGQAVSEGELPYQLWREPLRRLLITVDADDEDAGVLKQVVPDIDRLLGRDIPNAPPLEGRDAERRLVTAIVSVFRHALADAGRGLLVILEDLQWTSRSLDVIPLLMAAGAHAPLMIVGSYRDDEAPDLPDRLPEGEVLRLERLGSSAIRELSEAMLGDSGRKPQVINLLEHETEGNVFFLVEVLRALAEEAGNLERIGTMTLPANVFAGGIQKIIQRRLNQVPPLYRPLLNLAAVAGRQLDTRLIARVAGATDLDAWLTACVNAAVIDFADEHWRFAHDKLREFLLEQLPPDEGRRAHGQVAEAIEAVYADDLNRYAAALMLHWREAGDERKEGHYALIAAEQAYDSSAYQDAQRWFGRALEIRAYEEAENPAAREAQLHYQFGNAYYSASDYEAAREQQRAGLALFEALGDRKGIADTVNALGEADMRQGLLDSAQTLYQQALAIRQELDLTKEIGYSYMNLGVVEANRGNLEAARDLFKLCLDYMEEVGAPRDLARALNNYANINDMLGDKTEARQIHLRALEIRERVHDLHGICYSVGNLGMLEIDLENYDEALALLEKALGIARQIADRNAIATYLASLGDVSFKLHDYGQAQNYFQQSLDLRRALEDRLGVIITVRDLGSVAREIGDYDAALGLYGESLAMSFQHKFDNTIWPTIQQIARLLLAQQKQRPALKLLAFLISHRDTPDSGDQELINDLESRMTETAFASATAGGEALTLDDVRAKVEQGDLNF